MAKIIHYRSRCIGCGICYELQPALWRMSRNDGKATLVKATNKKGVYVREADITQIADTNLVIEACPVNVIKLV